MTRKRGLDDLMHGANLSISDLARRSGVSTPTARRAVRGDHDARVNTSSAQKIADALGSSVDEINWPGGLANTGRTAGTGGQYTRKTS